MGCNKILEEIFAYMQSTIGLRGSHLVIQDATTYEKINFESLEQACRDHRLDRKDVLQADGSIIE